MTRAPASSPDGIWRAVGARVSKRAPRSPQLWSSIDERVDPANLRPSLRSDIELKEFTLRWGNDYAVIANRRDGIYYRLEPEEVEIVKLMDGTRSVHQIVVDRLQVSGGLDIDGVVALVELLEEGNFFEERFVNIELAIERALRPPQSWSHRIRSFAKTLTVEWEGADGVVRWLYNRGLRVFFGRWAQIPCAAVSLLGLVAFAFLLRSGRFALGDRSAASEGLALVGLGYFLTFVHELGHALVLIHFGRRVKSAGFLIYFGTPAFFVDSTDGLLMDRRKRMLQSSAGPYAEMIVAGVAAIFVWAFPQFAISRTLYKFAILNYFVLFMNLVPFLELDGYFLFSDLIQVPDLRARSLAFVRYDLLDKLRRRDSWSLQEGGLGIYSLLGLAFTAFTMLFAYSFWKRFFGGLVSRLWHGGLSGRAILVALAVFVGGPLLRGAVDLLRLAVRELGHFVEHVRFKLQTRWRVDAARLIDALPILDDLPSETLDDLAGRVHLRRLRESAFVFRQGQIADAFYIVRDGLLQVVEEDPATGRDGVLRMLRRGDAFGELGLIKAGTRAASVRSVTASEVFVVDKGTFDRLLADAVQVERFSPTLHAIQELSELRCLAHLGLNELARLLDFGEWTNIPPGKVVFRQGDSGDYFYAIQSGRIEVERARRVIQTLGPGGFFGELALLTNAPRAATVRTRTPARVFRVNKRGFDRLIKGAFGRGTLAPHARLDRTSQH